MKLSYFLIFITLSIHTVVSAQTALAIPNTFTNGEIIDADNINQNFTEIETHINQNQGHKHLYVVDANDVELGNIIRFEEVGALVVISNKGYIAAVNSNITNTNLVQVFFESPDCSGQSYTLDPIVNDPTLISNIIMTKLLFWDEGRNKYFYIDQQTPSVLINAQSYYNLTDSLNCLPSSSLPPGVPFLINDYSVTGMPDDIALPIKFIYK